jgi:RHS repeat-associated protein
VGITYPHQPGKETTFAYDGLNRRVAIATTAARTTTTTDYLWCGSRICQSRASRSAVSRLYFDEGEAIPGAKALLYYGPDQLGSVRDVYATSPAFSMVQSYDYDPHGNPVKTPAIGPLTDFRYAGMFYPDNGEADGGLYLTQYRAYDPRVGRWLSRDPIGEFGATSVRFGEMIYGAELAGSTSALRSRYGFDSYGRMRDPLDNEIYELDNYHMTRTNLYNYVLNDPLNRIDRLGLRPYTDQFLTAQQAALRALKDIAEQSREEDVEYGGIIYQNDDGTYSYTAARTDNLQITVNPWSEGGCPGKKIAFYHTHNHGNHFSQRDIDYANEQHLNAFVRTPTGKFFEYSYPTGTVSPVPLRSASH